jgi:hypothetical protein
VVRMRKRKNAYRTLVSKPAGKSALGRTRRRWEDNVKRILNLVGDIGCIYMTRNSDVRRTICCTASENAEMKAFRQIHKLLK